MTGHDALTDSQPDACAVAVATCIEEPEDIVLLGRWDARPIVADRKPVAGRCLRGVDLDSDSVLAVFDRVFDEVLKQLSQLVGVAVTDGSEGGARFEFTGVRTGT